MQSLQRCRGMPLSSCQIPNPFYHLLVNKTPKMPPLIHLELLAFHLDVEINPGLYPDCITHSCKLLCCTWSQGPVKSKQAFFSVCQSWDIALFNSTHFERDISNMTVRQHPKPAVVQEEATSWPSDLNHEPLSHSLFKAGKLHYYSASPFCIETSEHRMGGSLFFRF